MSIQMRAIKYVMHGVTFYIGTMKAADIVENYKVDEWSESNPGGYQRDWKKSRSKKFANYLEKFKGIFHQTILINIRILSNISYSEINSVLTINGSMYLVDGQHRVGGLKLLVEKFPAEGDCPIPVLIMPGYSRELEAREFLIVNKTQKGVKADLTDRLLAGVIQNLNPDLLEIIGIHEPTDITQMTIAICDRMNKNRNSVWYKRIALPSRNASVNETAKQRSFTESLKFILKDNYIQARYNNDVNKIVKILNEYWNAISELCTNATGQNAKNYVLMKTTGPFIMHRLFPVVIIKSGNNPNKSKIKSILQRIDQMNDNDWHNNGELGEGSSQKFFTRRFNEFKSQVEDDQ